MIWQNLTIPFIKLEVYRDRDRYRVRVRVPPTLVQTFCYNSNIFELIASARCLASADVPNQNPL